MSLLKCILFLCVLNGAFGYKILLMLPFPCGSHAILGRSFVRHLLKAGHEVTYITSYPIDNVPNLQQIVLNETKLPDSLGDLNEYLQNGPGTSNLRAFLSSMINLVHTKVLNEQIYKFLEDPTQQYDLVIAEWMYSEVYSGFSTVFQCPFMWFFPYDHELDILRLMHEVPNAASVPNTKTANTPPMNFIQRLQELWYQAVYLFYKKFYFLPKEVEIYEQVFGRAVKLRGRSLPPYHSIQFNASMALCNTHSTVRIETTKPMNYKAIGGIHIDDNVKPLPEDLKEVMDKSTQGVILFSMGSFLKTKNLPDEFKSKLLSMFGGLNQTVIWKMEKKSDLPDNVKVFPWLPQHSILAHKNCVLFITHGGILSTTESIHFGVPIIGIPAFSDQFMNIKVAVKNGFGKQVTFSSKLADDLKEAIDEVLGNSRYTINAKRQSMIYHDRPVPPAKELVHWVEHVIKTQGAMHLRSPVLLMPWYQRWNLDVLIIAVLIVSSIKYIFLKLRNIITNIKFKKVKKM